MVSIAAALGDLASKIAGGAKDATPDDTVKLKVNGAAYEGWTEVTLSRSLKAASRTFSLTLIDKWAEKQEPWKVMPGDQCVITIGKEQMIRGYIDTVSPTFDANARSITVSGRDRVADMVDSSADHTPGNWQNIDLFTLAKKLAAPFGVNIAVDPIVRAEIASPFPGVKINDGETAFELLNKQAKLRGCILTSDGDGGILITRAGVARSSGALVQGENILTASATFSEKDRFSKYIVKSQDGGLDGAEPDVDFACQAFVTDPFITRYRPIIITAEGAATAAVCKQRALWERSVRRGKSTVFRCSVPGWRQSNGRLWTPNELVRVKSPWTGIDVELLLTEASLKKTADTTTSDLVLEHPAAYNPDPTLIDRKEPWRQLVIQESARK